MPQIKMFNEFSQHDRIRSALESAQGRGWIPGIDFINGTYGSPILQYHARIWELQRQGFDIEGKFLDDHNYKSYRIKGRDIINQN